MQYLIREMKESEYGLLKDFLYQAIFVPEGEKAPPTSILDNPDLQLYISDFGKQSHDIAFVAEVNAIVVGVVWVRMMKDYGYIDEHTPSFAISIYKEYRGDAIGTNLMKRMLMKLKSLGYKQASLAVQKENYAFKMYASLGFQIVKESEEEFIMVKKL